MPQFLSIVSKRKRQQVAKRSGLDQPDLNERTAFSSRMRDRPVAQFTPGSQARLSQNLLVSQNEMGKSPHFQADEL